jgi:hypothetical protein
MYNFHRCMCLVVKGLDDFLDKDLCGSDTIVSLFVCKDVEEMKKMIDLFTLFKKHFCFYLKKYI